MRVTIDIMNDGIRVDAHQIEVYPGHRPSETIQIDVTNVVKRAIAQAIGLPDSTNPPK